MSELIYTHTSPLTHTTFLRYDYGNRLGNISGCMYVIIYIIPTRTWTTALLGVYKMYFEKILTLFALVNPTLVGIITEISKRIDIRITNVGLLTGLRLH